MAEEGKNPSHGGMTEDRNIPSPGSRALAMAEEGKIPSPRRAASVWDERPSGVDRKSLAGMSEGVKAILAPLLGGTKRHSEVEVDLGRDSDSSVYDSVPTGSTPMHRYSTVEQMTASEAANDTRTRTDTSPILNRPRDYVPEALNRRATEATSEAPSMPANDTGASTDDSAKMTQPRASIVPRRSYVPKNPYDSETLDRSITDALSDTRTSTDASAKINPPRPLYTSHVSESLYPIPPVIPEPSGDTETSADTSTVPEASNAPRRSYVPRRSYRPPEIKGKDEIKMDNSPSRSVSPNHPTYALVGKHISATKPKMNEYDNYLKEAGPQLRARVSSILADKSHEAGFERRLSQKRDTEEEKLEDFKEDFKGIYGEASGVQQPGQRPSIFDKLKDTVTGQLPGKGIYSGKATIDTVDYSDGLPIELQDNFPYHDVGIGSEGGKFDRDVKSEPVEAEHYVPQHMNGPNEDLSKST